MKLSPPSPANTIQQEYFVTAPINKNTLMSSPTKIHPKLSGLLPVESNHRTSEGEYPVRYPIVFHTWTVLSSSDTEPSSADNYTYGTVMPMHIIDIDIEIEIERKCANPPNQFQDI